MHGPFQRFVAGLLVICVAALSLPAHAGMLSTEAAVAPSAATAGERARVAKFLEREEVRAQLEAHGVSKADVAARIGSMTDEEVSDLAGRIDALPAGGDLLGVLLTVFIVLLITDILGFTKVFPFTRPVR